MYARMYIHTCLYLDLLVSPPVLHQVCAAVDFTPKLSVEFPQNFVMHVHFTLRACLGQVVEFKGLGPTPQA